MIAARASAFPIDAEGHSGDEFATAEGTTIRKALWELQAYSADQWRRVEADPTVQRVEVVVEIER